MARFEPKPSERAYFDGMSRDEFRELERCAVDGLLDFTLFPAAEYKYFDTLSRIGKRLRAGDYPEDFAKQDADAARRTYRCELEQLRMNLEANRAYQAAILKSDELRIEITKSRSAFEKLRRALDCVELLTSEQGFAARALAYIEEGDGNDED